MNWEPFLYLVCTLFKVHKVHSLNVPYFQVHYSNFETSLTQQFISNTMFIAQVLLRSYPVSPLKKSKVNEIVPHFVPHLWHLWHTYQMCHTLWHMQMGSLCFSPRQL